MARSLEVSVPTIRDYLDIVHQTFLWRNLLPYEKNPLKKVQKSSKGYLRDSGIHHHYLKIQDLDDLLVHPSAGQSFEAFVIEELFKSVSFSFYTQVDFYYYRTIDKSEVDLIIDGPYGPVPIEIKLGSQIS